MNFGRGDFIATKLALIVVTIATLVTTIGLPGLAWLRGDALEARVDTGTAGAGEGLSLRDGVVLEWSSRADVTVSDAGAATWLVSLLPGMATLVAVVLATGILWLLVSRIQGGAPFAQTSVTLLRALALVALAYAFVAPTLKGVANSALLEAAVVDPGTRFEISLGPETAVLVVALVCATMAEAFAVGARMQRDVDGLV